MLGRLEDSARQLRQFTADASHELRTPVTILRGEIEGAIQQSQDGTVSADMLSGLLEQVQRLSDITEKLLILTNADAGRLVMEKAQLNLSALCASLVEDAEILGAGKAVTIEPHLESGVVLHADQHVISRVLLNLIDNAIKYNEPGGRVCIDLRASGDGAVVEVGNTGPEIPEELHEAIFDRFVRVNTSRSRESGGSGLGLSICRELLTAHGGQLTLRKSAAGWTVFRLEI
jgi:signal transduction histidine kinase